MGVATLVSLPSLIWVLVLAYLVPNNIPYFGWLSLETGGALFASVACLAAFIASISFCLHMWRQNDVRIILKSWVGLPLVIGVVGDLTLCWHFWDNPKLWFPPTFFVWPAIAFLGAGFVRRMLPNPVAQSDVSRSARGAPAHSASGHER